MVPDEETELGTWMVTGLGALVVFEDLEGLADLVLDLEDLEDLAAAAAVSSTTGGVATVRLVPTAMIEGAGTGGIGGIRMEYVWVFEWVWDMG